MKTIGAAAAIALLALAPLAALLGCKSDTKPRQVSPGVIRDTPSVLRGTVGSECTLRQADPVLVSGYGLVVGLHGTGGGDLDERVAATMERQLGLHQVTKTGPGLEETPLEGLTPRQVLRSKDVAVVIVYALVIPGAPAGATFDVYARAVNRGPDISLEGGTLWSTDLQVGGAAAFGGHQTRRLAVARGPVFLNPFVEPGSAQRISRIDGRILDGGRVVNPVDLELHLDNESHARCRAITSAINNRFPAQPGEDVTARGHGNRIVTVTVPAAYREHSQEFLKLLMHTRIEQSVPEAFAREYCQKLKEEPYLADELSWALQALPQKTALPFVREMYDYPDDNPRFAALRAGAGLSDPLAAPHLKALAKDRSKAAAIRADAIRLLGRLAAGPTVDTALQEQLEAPELSIRVAAYEALASRAEEAQMRRYRAQVAAMPVSARISMPAGDEARQRLELPGDSIQGIRRKVVEGKFLLDIVPVGDPLIYVTQQGRPRIVVFGRDVGLKRPLLVSAWDGSGMTKPDETPEPEAKPKTAEEEILNPTPTRGPTQLPRLMLAADSLGEDIRIMYRRPDRLSESGDTIPGRAMSTRVKPDLISLTEVMARQPSPEDPRPGFGMSYSELVGALYAIQQQGGIGAPFVVEDDRLRAGLMAAASSTTGDERPETTKDAKSITVYEPVDKNATPAQPETKPANSDKPSLVVPLPAPSKGK